MPASPTGGPGNRCSPPGRRPSVVTLLGLGTMTALCLVVGFVLGWLVDRQLASAPAFTLIGLLTGLAAGVWASYATIRNYFRD